MQNFEFIIIIFNRLLKIIKLFQLSLRSPLGLSLGAEDLRCFQFIVNMWHFIITFRILTSVTLADTKA